MPESACTFSVTGEEGVPYVTFSDDCESASVMSGVLVYTIIVVAAEFEGWLPSLGR